MSALDSIGSVLGVGGFWRGRIRVEPATKRLLGLADGARLPSRAALSRGRTAGWRGVGAPAPPGSRATSLFKGFAQAPLGTPPFFEHLRRAEPIGVRASDHHDVEPRVEQSSRMPKGFAHDTLDPIADDRVAHPPGHRDTQASWSFVAFTRPNQQHEGRRVHTPSCRLDSPEVSPTANASLPAETTTLGRSGFHGLLREALRRRCTRAVQRTGSESSGVTSCRR